MSFCDMVQGDADYFNTKKNYAEWLIHTYI